MPYLNEAKVMGNMANKPEMAMLANGVPYCYFAVRMVQKTPEGNIAEDYIRVVSYGDTATMVCRECDFGDLVLCVGRLSPKQWMTEAGREEYQLHFIAEAVQKVADGEGLMPPVTLDEAANAKASAFRSGEDELIHSDTYRFRGVRDPRPQKLYHPQPKPVEGWTLPEHYVSQESMAWMKNEEDRMRKKRETFGSLQHPPLNLSNADDRTEAHRIAATLIPWNLPRTNDGMYVRIPRSKCIPISNYIAILKAQNELLNSQPDDVRRLILDLASKRDIFLKASEDEARKTENEKRKAEEQRQREMAETPQETTPVAAEPKRVVGSSDPNDWFESDSNP
jgi:single-stranded DNA-binding protein